jgi:hypothetical protein
MRLAGLMFAAGIAHGAVVSHQWTGSTLGLKLDDGAAEIEWISPVAFRFTRIWGPQADRLPKITHEAVKVELEPRDRSLLMRSRYMNVEVDLADLRLAVRSGETSIAELKLEPKAGGLALHLAPLDKVFGGAAFFFSRSGYGMHVRAPQRCSIDAARGVIEAPATQSFDYVFYYGPAPKEILDQHQTVTGPSSVPDTALLTLPVARVPASASELENVKLNSWDDLAALVRRLIQGSFAATLYPALDLAVIEGAPGEVRQRAADLAAWMPVVYRSGGGVAIDRALRETWRPYWITYYREALDRGYPLIRPLPMQSWRDANADRQMDVFMIGDELLLAPVVAPGGKRQLELPMGIWTDLRTNKEYRGRQTIEVDAPVGSVPLFSRNGALFPMARPSVMELHYLPSLGGEFFLWEPDLSENSQFHASPAGDYYRLEIETHVKRTYEWVMHHMGAAREIADEKTSYTRVPDRAALRPNTWWHDAANNNLHVMLEAEPKSDRIVNVSF